MSDDQVGCEWVSVSSGTGLLGLSQTKAVKWLCVCVCVCVRACMRACVRVCCVCGVAKLYLHCNVNKNCVLTPFVFYYYIKLFCLCYIVGFSNATER